MNAKLDQGLHFLKQHQVDLDAFSHYLLFPIEAKWQKFHQVLHHQKVDLSAYYHYLRTEESHQETQNDSLSQDPRYQHCFYIGIQLLAQSKITLSELNALLQKYSAKTLSPEKLLQQILIQKKITSEEFFLLFNLKASPPTPFISLYGLRLHEGSLQFYEETNLHALPTLGGYFLGEEIGRGGMGIVYKAHHPGLNRTVAIKVLIAGEHASEKKIKRFLREIQTMAKLQHPGIVQILSSGEENGKHYFVMEYIEGNTLENQLKKGLSLRESVTRIQKVLEALHYAHTQGILHRDIKLSNLFSLADHACKIGDFGLAKDIFEENEQKLTQTGIILGTPHYLAPEQIEGKPESLDARCDLYAVGVCLYRLLTQRFPFQSKHQSELFQQILNELPPPPSKHSKKIHQDLDKIVLKALQKAPENRYRSAKEFAEDLRRFLNGYPIRARSTYRERLQEWHIRHRSKLALTSIFFLSALALLFAVHSADYFERHQNTQTSLKTVFELQEKASQENQKDFATQSRKLYHLLSALNLLNEASILDPKNYELLQEKRKLGLLLITLACEIRNYVLAEHLLQKFETWSSKNDPQFLQLQEKITTSQQSQRYKHLARLSFWKKYFEENLVEEDLAQEVIFEIAQMNEIEVFHELIKQIEEGTQLFISQNIQNRQRNTYYSVVASALGRLGSPKAIEFLWKNLEKMAHWIKTFPMQEQQKKIPELGFMIALTNALGNLNAFERFLALHDLTLKRPLAGLFVQETQRTYHKLAKLANFATQEQKKLLSAEDYLQRGLIKMQSNDFQGAILDYTEALQLDPKLTIAYLQRGISKRNLGDHEGAIADYTFIIESLDPKCASAYNNRGMVRKSLKQLDLAIEDFTQAIQADAKNSLFWTNRGIVWVEKKEYQKALDDFQKALQIQPLEANIYVECGNVYYFLNQWKLALENYNQAIQINPNFESAYVNRGIIKKNKGDLDGALQDYDKAISLNNQNALSYSNRGRAKELKGDIEGAIVDFTEVLRILPKDTMTFYHRGKLKHKINQIEEAKADFQSFLKQFSQKKATPDLRNAQQNILLLFPELSR